MMRAIRVIEFGGPEVMKILKDVPIPKPSKNQILVKVKYAGVNPVDTYIRSGTYKLKPVLPYTPGSDGAGIIESIEECSASFKKGDMVYFRNSLSGSYAEFALVDQENVFALNSNLSFSAGACLGVPFFTAYRAVVHKCRPTPGQSLLVHGASGAVGTAACQIGRALGLTVYGTAGSDAGLKLVLQNGAHFAFNHKTEGYVDDMKKSTSNKGFDQIIEMLANVNLETDLQLAAPGGNIVVVGSRGTIEVTPRHAMANELNIHGVMMGHATKEDINESAAFFAAGMEAGWLKPQVGQEFSFDQVAQAHTEVIAHTGGSKGKLVLKID